MIDARHVLLMILALLLCLPATGGAGAQQAEGVWTLTTPDFATQRIRLVAIGEGGVEIVEPNGETARLPHNRLVRLERSAPETGGAGPFVLYLRNGDRLHGRPLRLTETAFVMQVVSFGEVEVPLEQLQALVAGRGDDPARGPAPAADELTLANGDRLTGFLATVEGDQWTFSDQQGNETPLEASAVRRLRFADMGAPAAPVGEGWRVALASGSVLSLESLAFAEGRFDLSYGGREVAMQESALRWLEPVNGPVRWLTDLPFAEAEHVPYLGARFPAVAEALPEGGRGFVVRSQSRLSFDLPEDYDRFRTAYAIPRTMPQGSVDIRILLDGKPVHERAGLTAADQAEPVEIPLEGARRLTLEVAYGPGLDVQDVVHWIGPALIRDED